MNPYLFATIVLGLFAASAFTEPPPAEETPESVVVESEVVPDSLAQYQTSAVADQPEDDYIYSR
jgi:hypothetical protein